MRIVTAGSSGFLGGHLVSRLRADGHQVVRLVRRPPRDAREIQWDPAGGALDPAVLSTMDAVINLAGAGVGDRRWSDSYRRVLRDSRVDTTSTLARAIAAADPRPAVLLNASGVGYYGDPGDQPVDEESPHGEGFLAELCRVWEAATGPAEEAGVRVVRMRTGLPLDGQGGLLKSMLPLFRFGVAGRLGNGRQYWPWISTPDWLGAVGFLLARPDLAGPVNLTGPAPVTNSEFTRVLAGLLHRPALIPVPRLALRVALGEFAGETMVSQRVLPAVLTTAGYTFEHPDLTSALHWALHHP